MILPLILASPYLCTITACVIGWLKKSKRKDCEQINSSITLIVACRNEAINLPYLYQALKEQTEQPSEIILVNDHSTDDTPIILQKYCSQEQNWTYLSSDETGKKAALKKAVSHVTTTHVLFTDADCYPCAEWISEMHHFIDTCNCDLVLAPVVMKPDYSVFEKLQALDFASLVAANAGATLLNHPLYGNGANMMVKTEVWKEHEKNLKEEIKSGDDVFLIHSIKKNKGRICFAKSNHSIVFTKAEATIADFIHQRSRWGGKTIHYTDALTIIVACIVFLMNFMITVSLLLAPFFTLMFQYWSILWLSKLIVDSVLMIPFLIQTKQKKLIHYWLPLSLFYPIILTLLAFSSLFSSVKWKK